MVRSGDKLVCTNGNPFFKAGSTYTVGNIVTSKLFEVKVGANDEFWYATADSEGIYVRFNSKETAIHDAWFSLAK